MKLSLRFEGEEFPAALTLNAKGLPESVVLTDPARAPLTLCERVEALSMLIRLPGGWDCVHAVAGASTGYGPLVDRIVERLGDRAANEQQDTGESLAV